MGIVITIDGPAASGKSSVSRELAKRWGWKWVSTGAFYRGLAYAAIRNDIDLSDVSALVNLVNDPVWSVRMEKDNTQVHFNGVDVTSDILHEDVGSFASKISHYPDVRKALLENQRQCSHGPLGLIAEGRDCGTVVFPQASAKIYLTASSENRAARRAVEHQVSQKDIMKSQKIRDAQDINRKTAPLQIPENAFVLDTSHMTFDEVVEEVDKYVRQSLKNL